MGKRKPLTIQEKYIANKCGFGTKYRYSNGEHRKVNYTPSEIRAKLKQREKDSRIKRFEELKARLPAKTFAEVQSIANALSELDKYQGYLYKMYFEAREKVKTMTDEEIKRELFIEAI